MKKKQCCICLNKAPVDTQVVCSKCRKLRNRITWHKRKQGVHSEVIEERFMEACAFPDPDDYIAMIQGIVTTKRTMRGRVFE